MTEAQQDASTTVPPVPTAAKWGITVPFLLIVLIVAYFRLEEQADKDFWMDVTNAVAGGAAAIGATTVALWPDSKSKSKGAAWANLVGRCLLAAGAIYLAVAIFALVF